VNARGPVGLAAFFVALGGCGESGSVVGGLSALTSLSVAPLELSPPFSPDVHDYSIRCSAGPNSVWITAEAGPDTVVTIETPSPPTSVQPTTVTANVLEDQAIVVHAAGVDATQSYWIRCLPHDFPVLVVTPHPEAGARTPGYYLLGNATTTPSSAGFAMVLDSNGTPVWYRRVSNRGALNLDRLPDGSLSYVANLGAFGSDPAATYVVQRLEPWSSRSLASVGSPTDEHELQVLPDGHFLLFTYPLLTGVDLRGLAGFDAPSTMADCVLQELDAQGRLAWEWRASDHIDAVRESTDPQPETVGAQGVADVFHLNSADVDASGNLLLSARNLDAVFYVERASGRILWKLGGAPYSKDGAQLMRVVGDPETSFYAQHDARFLPGGHISLFDDHSTHGGVARGVEYALDLQAGTARLVWEYRGAVTAAAMGSLRRYADGATLVAWGLSSQPLTFSGVFTEVDAAGHDLLDVGFAEGEATYRAVKVPVSSFDLDALRATAGHP